MRTLFASGHVEPVATERERLRARVVIAERRLHEYGGLGYEVALDLAQRALLAFERSHPVGGQELGPGAAALASGTSP